MEEYGNSHTNQDDSDEDEFFQEWRQKRMREIEEKKQSKNQESGDYMEIKEDEFLP
eukprot:CAMPEP_0168313480 /NCGR_PEP_ID=MMETSP0210-20121227/2157_1 /TAXON_ID=40633 /ORGANISM="Condylostoma magnum, Strain COL2" /LENGTH=55 /DNA_ID=CAMNT_0008270427 /DNA_START=75 /DNA_END=242 /DNA_ORIENTATION=+